MKAETLVTHEGAVKVLSPAVVNACSQIPAETSVPVPQSAAANAAVDAKARGAARTPAPAEMAKILAARDVVTGELLESRQAFEFYRTSVISCLASRGETAHELGNVDTRGEQASQVVTIHFAHVVAWNVVDASNARGRGLPESRTQMTHEVVHGD